MAFSSKSNFGPSSGIYAYDQSQLDKIREFGYTLTPVSTNVQLIERTLATQKQVLPGTSIITYVDANRNSYVVGDNGTVYRLDYLGAPGPEDRVPTPTPPTVPTPPSVPPPSVPPSVPPTVPPPTSPPGNFGSGKIFSRFENGDIVPNQQEVITRALWSNNVGNLTTFHTSSIQTATQKRYYYEIYNSGSGECGAESQFSVAYGNKVGSGSADEGGQINDTPSRAIYGQYRLLCLNGDTSRFTIGGTTTDHVYVINVNRARMREYLDEGNIEVNLAHLSGSEYVAGGATLDTHTGSNVALAGTGQTLRLVDDSRIADATITEAGEVYNIVSGSIEDGVYNSSSPQVFGLMYRRLGIIVLDANKLDLSASFGTVTGSEVAGDNAYKLFLAMSGAAQYTDASGDPLGFQGRSSERVKSTHYFCRVKNAEYNFSNNPTYTTGSEGDLSEPTFINDPVVYITTVGLYNERKECIAVAKVSKAIQKSFTKEALIKVKLEF